MNTLIPHNSPLRSRIRSIATYRPAHPLSGIAASALVVALTLTGATRAGNKNHAVPAADAPAGQVRIDCKIIEIPAGTLLQPDAAPPVFRQDLAGVLKKIGNHETRNSPGLVTSDRQSAMVSLLTQFEIPGKIGGKPKMEEIGHWLDVTPRIQGDAVTLDVTYSVRKLKDAATGNEIWCPDSLKDGQKVEISEHRTQKTVTVNFGETFAISGGKDGKGKETVILLNPKRR